MQAYLIHSYINQHLLEIHQMCTLNLRFWYFKSPIAYSFWGAPPPASEIHYCMGLAPPLENSRSIPDIYMYTKTACTHHVASYLAILLDSVLVSQQ